MNPYNFSFSFVQNLESREKIENFSEVKRLNFDIVIGWDICLG